MKKSILDLYLLSIVWVIVIAVGPGMLTLGLLIIIEGDLGALGFIIPGGLVTLGLLAFIIDKLRGRNSK